MQSDMIERNLFQNCESFKAEDYKIETDKLEWLTVGLRSFLSIALRIPTAHNFTSD